LKNMQNVEGPGVVGKINVEKGFRKKKRNKIEKREN
jgi:hypothetical protein